MDVPAIRFQAKSDLDDVFRLEQFDQNLMAVGSIKLEYKCLIQGRKLHHVRPAADNTQLKYRLGFSIESDGARPFNFYDR